MSHNTDELEHRGLSQEELEAEEATALPDREAMSIIRHPIPVIYECPAWPEPCPSEEGSEAMA
jgi:hypothetical protein